MLRHRRPPQWWRKQGRAADSFAEVDRFLAPSRFIESKHRELGLALDCEHLPNFVPEPRVPAHAADIPGGGRFLFVGRLERVKGPQTLLPVFARLPDARLVIVGDGKDGRRLQRRAAGCPNITFLGRRSHRELSGIYRSAVAVIVPSLCYENQSLVVLEAFASGIPVIARDIGGLPELVAASGGGVLYRSDEELVQAVRKLRSDPSFAAELGRRGRDAYLRQWSPRIHVDRYLAIIRRCGAG
jgi:glycosyltransferase involved in cell wall biosynthesis